MLVTRVDYRQRTPYLDVEDYCDLPCAYRYARHFSAPCRCLAELLRHTLPYRHLPLENRFTSRCSCGQSPIKQLFLRLSKSFDTP